MARIRTIKPEFWTHHIMGRASDSVKCLAIALLNHADDEGYFLADPQVVRSACRPFDDDSRMCHGLITELSRIGWIEICRTEEGLLIGRVVKFKDNQVINRPKLSKLKDSWNDHGRVTDESLTNHGRVTAGMERNGTGNREQGKELKKHFPDFEQKTEPEKPKTRKPLPEYSGDFLKFWEAYPSKTGKGAAFTAWRKHKPPIEKVIEAIGWQQNSQKWRDGFVPYPQTYINQRRWEDEPDAKLVSISASKGAARSLEIAARLRQQQGGIQ